MNDVPEPLRRRVMQLELALDPDESTPLHTPVLLWAWMSKAIESLHALSHAADWVPPRIGDRIAPVGAALSLRGLGG